MKRIPALKCTLLARGLVAALLTIATLAPAAGADDAVMQTTGGVSYVSGGVGTDSIDRLSALSKDFNLKLVFALNSGDYVSGVGVAISDTAGKSLLNIMSDGPWLLTKLPAGNYQIVATFAGTAVTRRATVGAANLNTVDMRWASE
ncbi:MAG: carboxypeptidase regulatory-like domain-containing protein [Burkholderiales bacterium]